MLDTCRFGLQYIVTIYTHILNTIMSKIVSSEHHFPSIMIKITILNDFFLYVLFLGVSLQSWFQFLGLTLHCCFFLYSYIPQEMSTSDVVLPTKLNRKTKQNKTQSNQLLSSHLSSVHFRGPCCLIYYRKNYLKTSPTAVEQDKHCIQLKKKKGSGVSHSTKYCQNPYHESIIEVHNQLKYKTDHGLVSSITSGTQN